LTVGSGRLLWKVKAPGDIGVVTALDSASLLLQGWDQSGTAWLDRRGVDSGGSLWAKPLIGLRAATAVFHGAPGEVLLVSNGKVIAVSLDISVPSERDALTFGGGERPLFIRELPDMVAVASEQNVAGIDATGEVRYRIRVLHPVKESERKLLGILKAIGTVAAVYSIASS
jgi:hypothetical protein